VTDAPAAAPGAGAPVLSCAEVTKTFGAVTALDAVSLDLARGDTLAVVGPSGCGKSSLLRAVAGLTGIDGGSVTLDGRVVVGPGVFEPAERRGVGIVFQDLALFPHLSVADNIAFGLRHGSARRDARAKVEEMLALVGMVDKADRYPHELSGGEQQRVALGRALALDPALVLLDEPFSQLDRGLAVTVRNEAMATLRAAGATVVLVTHDQDEALAVADRVAVMQVGRLVQVDAPARVFHRPVTEFAASFLGEADLLAGQRRGAVADTALGTVTLADDGPACPDGPVKVLVRPHHLAPAAEGPGAAAVVSAVEFRGGAVLHTLRLDDGETVRASLPHGSALAVGARVVVPAPGEALVAFG